jgi:formylglycine-generating enzyme required for sulfatase activity
MHGNVYEWCADGWDEKAYTVGKKAVDPIIETTKGVHVLRGGCFSYEARLCRSARRNGYDKPFGGVGFRICFRPN